MTEESRRGRRPVYQTDEERIAAKRARDAASHQERMKDPAYREARSKATQTYRKKNPNKARELQSATSLSRRKRSEEDPDYAESVRRAAREAHAQRARKRQMGAPDGWKIVVRMNGELRGRAITKVRFQDDKVAAIARVKTRSDEIKRWPTREEADAFAASLLEDFPGKIEVARVDVA